MHWLWQHTASPLPEPVISLSVPKDLTPLPQHSITPLSLSPRSPTKGNHLTSEHTPISSLLKVSWPTESLIPTQRKLYINKRWPAKPHRKKLKKNPCISPQLKLTEWATCFLATDAYSTGSYKFTVQFGVAWLPWTSELNKWMGSQPTIYYCNNTEWQGVWMHFEVFHEWLQEKVMWNNLCKVSMQVFKTWNILFVLSIKGIFCLKIKVQLCCVVTCIFPCTLCYVFHGTQKGNFRKIF